jgi:hypothetical protein
MNITVAITARPPEIERNAVVTERKMKGIPRAKRRPVAG